ncbi:MAG: GNAT family N-acetyltransferase [Tepidisphaeraceae bacterium]
MLGLSFHRRRFKFLDPGTMVEQELELVEPSPRWLDSLLLTTGSPLSAGDRSANLTRYDWLEWLQQYPRGREAPNPGQGRCAMYTFWMRLRPQFSPPVEMAGSISLRIGDTEDLRRYMGHIGYGVYPPAHGNHLAERTCRLVLPLAKRHGMSELWITVNPDNWPSRRTCERLGADMIEVVDLPTTHPLYHRGDRQKCRYRLRI